MCLLVLCPSEFEKILACINTRRNMKWTPRSRIRDKILTNWLMPYSKRILERKLRY